MTSRRPLNVVRAVLAVLAALVVGASMLAGVVGTAVPAGSPAGSDVLGAQPELELAADARQFAAGNIISDALFYDGSAMSAGQVQNFLDSKNPGCRPGAQACLKDYRENTRTRPADSRCNGYQGVAGESAAAIVHKVGVSCGISQRALLVMLQKEQSLVTATGSSLTSRRYQIAMGYGCPDTAVCDTLYYGFANQLYSAARQFKLYAANPQNYAHQPGRTNNVRWSPTSSCGSGQVHIQNKATAGLYNYTPYQPNQAALNAGYGMGDKCSAYGNRNFWLYYTDWFGSTQSSGGTAIVARANAPDAGPIGKATSGIICGLVGGGCFRAHEVGAIYWSPSSGAHIVWGQIHARWAGLGWETGRLGYPTGSEMCGLRDGGCLQEFQKGLMYWSPATGAQPVGGAIRTKYASTKWETGPLGYPLTASTCGLTGGGCYQEFQGGHIYWSPTTGAHPIVTGAVWDLWKVRGHEKGLGYPTGDQVCGPPDNGCSQRFQNATVYAPASQPARIVGGAIRAKHDAMKAQAGVLGYPMGATSTCGLTGGGCYQEFQGGHIYWSPTTGAHPIVTGAVWDLWKARGYEKGLGYPTGGENCHLVRGGCFQPFQKGNIYSSPTAGTHVVWGEIFRVWGLQKWERGPLGYPTSAETCGLSGGRCRQYFEGGTMIHSPSTGTHMVWGEISKAWLVEPGALGYPTSGEICGLAGRGCFQVFQKGHLYWSPTTGAHMVSGKIFAAWGAQGWETGRLGYPTEDPVTTESTITQRFQGGTLVENRSTGKVTRK